MDTIRKILNRGFAHRGVVVVFLSLIIPGVAFASSGPAMGEFLYWILSLFAWLAGTMGALMGMTIYYTIVRMGVHVHALGGINSAWEVFRNLGNIFLVFGFMAIGVATILDNATYGAKKALPKLLIVALTLNFSLFIAEFIVDTGNMFATQFYTQISGGKIPTKFSASTEPITSAIFTSLKLTTLYNTNGTGTISTTTGAKGSPAQQHWFITFFMGIVLFIITAFVLGSIALVLISRFVILLFLLITSPIGFIGLADIPLLSKYGKAWWKALTDQTLLAPILLLLLLVVTVLIQSNGGIFASTKGYAAAFGGDNSTSIGTLLLEFAVVIGLLIASLVIAKSLSGKAAAFATKTSAKLTFGSLGFAGRSTIGWGSQRLSKGLAGTKFAKIPILGRAVIGGTDKIAKSSFDMRAGRIGGALKSQGITLGGAQKGGFQAWEQKKIKGREDYAGMIKETTQGERDKTEENNRKIKLIDEESITTKKQHVDETEEMTTRHTTKQTELNEQVAAAEHGVATAQRDKKFNVPGADAALAKAQDTLKKQEKLRDDAVAQQEDEATDLKDVHKKEMQVHTDGIDELKKQNERIKGAGMERAKGYAENINKGPGKLFKRNRIARSNILGGFGKKDKDQKILNAILDAAKSADKKEKKDGKDEKEESEKTDEKDGTETK